MEIFARQTAYSCLNYSHQLAPNLRGNFNMGQDPVTVVHQFSATLEGQGPLEAGLKVAVRERIGQQDILVEDVTTLDE